MNNMIRPLAARVTTLLVPTLMLALSACGDKPDEAAAATSAVAQNIGPENVAVVTNDTLSAGPAISGTLVAEREARIRAEVAGAVLQLYVEEGERVSAGAPLARIDDAAVRDGATSARSLVAQAIVAAEQADRELQRAKTLAAAGAIADREVEGAERAQLVARAQLEDAKARLASAEKTLRNTTVRAPFAGIVATRDVSPGDIVAPGAAMFTVIDPRSLRLEGSVPTSALGDVRVGAPVLFTVNGNDRMLEGKITRVSPMVDAQTKQVKLLATVPNANGQLVAGLFVEGRIAAEKRVGVMVPERAVDQTGIVPTVMRLKNGKVEKTEVQVGVRDEAAEALEVTTGLAAGDTVLLGAARGISVGTAVVVSTPKDATPSAASPVKNN